MHTYLHNMYIHEIYIHILIGDSSAISDTSRGVRCIQFHPEGIHLAIGDRLGNLKYGSHDIGVI